jgi:transcriptional regulator with XRE-family HTH domain
LGDLLRGLRLRNRWTLREMSTRTGIPLSTLSKVERDELSLTYDKLAQLADRLQIDVAELFSRRGSGVANARRSVDRAADGPRVNEGNNDYHYLCADLRQKRMTPMLMRIRADSADFPAQLADRAGEEYIYVLEGCVRVHTEFYETVVLKKGESMYIDSSMGHAYSAGDGCIEAAVLRVCAETSSGGLPLIGNR